VAGAILRREASVPCHLPVPLEALSKGVASGARATRPQQLMQAEVVPAELPAVVSSGDLHDTRHARGLDARAQRLVEGGAVQTIRDDLEDGIHGGR
jgi:hypothetical protein